MYLDTQTGFLFEKRDNEAIDPWGHHILTVPAAYVPTLKWFSAFPPTNDVGVPGDYCIAWAGFANYGIEPSLYGPKQTYGWPELGSGPDTIIDPLYAADVLPVGLLDEGTTLAFSTSTQIIVTGLADEYILAIPTLLDADEEVLQIGLASGPTQTPMDINPAYTSIDVHTV